MPLDASDRIRKTNNITIFQGYANEKAITQPGVNVSSCITFQTSTIQNYANYAISYQVESGREYFNICKTLQ
jgi:hypothetical protein